MKAIPSYEGLYSVTKDGRVFSHRNNIYLKAADRGWGYLGVCLSKKSKLKTINIHRLVACAYIENPESKPEVNHINGNKKDNNVENLEWATCKENVNHGIRLGLCSHAKGEKSGRSKLTEKDVLQIKKLLSEGLTPNEIAKDYQVGARTIRHIRSGDTWSHV